MLKFVKIILCLLVMAMPLSASARKSARIDTVVFETKLHCSNCVKKVEANVAYLKGVEDLQVSLEKQEILISFNSEKTNAETLRAEIVKLGYPAKVKSLAVGKTK